MGPSPKGFPFPSEILDARCLAPRASMPSRCMEGKWQAILTCQRNTRCLSPRGSILVARYSQAGFFHFIRHSGWLQLVVDVLCCGADSQIALAVVQRVVILVVAEHPRSVRNAWLSSCTYLIFIVPVAVSGCVEKVLGDCRQGRCVSSSLGLPRCSMPLFRPLLLMKARILTSFRMTNLPGQ